MLAVIAIAVVLAAPAEAVPDQTLVFYNARIALREDRPAEALKLWLLHNSLEDRGEPPTVDSDFRSVVWAALGAQGLCPDGFKEDTGGAGLWPLAMHNWILDASRRGERPPVPPPFGALEVARQQRFVSLSDVPSAGELKTVTFRRTGCFAPAVLLLGQGESPQQNLRDRRVSGRLMRRLLQKSLTTLDRRKVPNVAAIEARIFDLDLALVDLYRRYARREATAAGRLARTLGVSEEGAREVRETVQPFPPGSEGAAFLEKTFRWSVEDWMTLSRSRRAYLFAQARILSRDPDAMDQLILGVADRLIERKAGEDLEEWIGFLDATTAQRRALLFSGARGERILELDPATGFHERSAIALQRGVAFLEAGEMRESLRSLAFALAHADESRDSDDVRGLARRWLSFVLSRFEADDDLISTLKALVPPEEYGRVAEDLAWRAALHADSRSFDRIVATTRRGGTFETRAARLRLLAQGRAGAMVKELGEAARTEPNLTMRFVRLLLERLEAEDAGVRAANAPMLQQMKRILDPLADDPRKSAQARTAEELLDRTQAILDGLGKLDSSATGKARELAPGRETFAGSVRLAPGDPLPWPFFLPEAEAPSPFTPLLLEPREWRDGTGSLVFGWRISDASE